MTRHYIAMKMLIVVINIVSFETIPIANVIESYFLVDILKGLLSRKLKSNYQVKSFLCQHGGESRNPLN